MDAATHFYAYINTQVYTMNVRPLDAIRQYLLDNNIPINFKRINAVRDAVNMIAHHCNNQLILYNNNINHNYINNDNYNNDNYVNELNTTLNMTIDITNIINNFNN